MSFAQSFSSLTQKFLQTRSQIRGIGGKHLAQEVLDLRLGRIGLRLGSKQASDLLLVVEPLNTALA